MAFLHVNSTGTLVASGPANIGVTQTAYTAGSTGNLIIIGAYSSDVTKPLTISDTQGNTWITANPNLIDGTVTQMQSWYALAKNTTATDITVKSVSTSAAFQGLSVDEFSGPHATPLDQVNHNVPPTSSGTTVTTPSITLGADDCVLWSLIVDNVTGPGSFDGTTGTTGFDDLQGEMSGWRILTGRSGASVTAAWTTPAGSQYDVFVASFKPTAGAVVTPVVPFANSKRVPLQLRMGPC